MTEERHAVLTAPTVDRVLEVMAEVIAEYGEDHVYSRPVRDEDDFGIRCLYVEDNQPSCLIAQVMVRLGVSVSVLAECEGEPAPMVADEVWPASSQALREVLEAAQLCQDASHPWGKALAAAQRTAERAGRW